MDVYVVDDNPDMRDVLRLVLSDEGYHVIDVADGSAAPDILRNSADPCIVLLDLKMLHDGVTVLEAVADDLMVLGRHAYILMSGDHHGLEAASALFKRLGATVLRKPFDLDDLVALVANAASRLQST
jgi:two-component system nitrogen regulation response regulator NtrX